MHTSGYEFSFPAHMASSSSPGAYQIWSTNMESHTKTQTESHFITKH